MKKVFATFDKILMKKDEKFGSAPLGSMVFLDDEKRKEWDEMDPGLKTSTMNILHTCAREMETKVMVEMLCNIIGDLDKRITELENQ